LKPFESAKETILKIIIKETKPSNGANYFTLGVFILLSVELC
jgi:hypothetical protein